jgi:manganese transport protein
VTRSLAIVPAALTIYFSGDRGTYHLLLLSQVILCMQLPFAIIPLIHFTNDRRRMGDFANKGWVVALSWTTAAVVLLLNVWLLVQGISEWLAGAGRFRPYLILVLIPVGFVLSGLLRTPVTLPATAASSTEAPVYRRILVPLDHTALDRQAIAHAASMARTHHAKLFLLHVEEGVTSQVYGSLSSTAEVQEGQKYLDDIVESLRNEGIDVETMVAHSSNPNREIVRCAREIQPDLLVMGAHGHGGLKDLIFGTTINSVRHKLRIPLLVVRGTPN